MAQTAQLASLSAPPPSSHDAAIESFYHLPGNDKSETYCQGLACFVARHRAPVRWQKGQAQPARVYCLGKCYHAPACSREDERPRIESHARQPILLNRLLDGGARTLSRYTQRGGYRAFEAALRLTPGELVRTVAASGLRGRGGAGFPTGDKWWSVCRESAPKKVVIANADEGDPGAYMERFLLEDDPHCLIEAMLIAGFAVGASEGIIYLRKEYPHAAENLLIALDEARKEGFLGQQILRSPFCFDLRLVIGQGSYVCGEETAMLNSIEGKRPEPRTRPPYASSNGLFGLPTLVNNVETLYNIPWIIQHGGETYRSLGFSKSAGNKLVSLNSLFRRPGLYEIELGMPVRQIVEELGGGLQSGRLKGLIIGGPLAGIVPPELLDTPFSFEELRSIGASVGHGGIVAFDEHTSIVELIHHIFDFGAYESCGKCTPCRLGTRRIERLSANGGIGRNDRAEWQRIISALALTSFCGLGTGLADFARSVERYYGSELVEKELVGC